MKTAMGRYGGYSGNGNMSPCKTCGTMILWVKTRAGKNMPCNHLLVNYRKVKGGSQKIVTPEGDVVSGEIVPPDQAQGVGYISHFATCEGYRAGVRAGATRIKR